MLVSMIAALAEDRIIGSEGGGIPWELPRDRDYFRSYTRGKWMLLGRRTYEEMRGWFTDQKPIVVTTRAAYRPFSSSHPVAHSIPEAIGIAHKEKAAELVIAGGGVLYATAMPFADKLVLTRLEADFPVEKPIRFPAFEDSGVWERHRREFWPPDKANAFPAAVEIWHKRLPTPKAPD